MAAGRAARHKYPRRRAADARVQRSGHLKAEDEVMKWRTNVVAAAILGGIAVWACWQAAPARAASQGDTKSAYSYVGTKKCKKCHLDTHKSWATTKMATAFETLQPGKATAAKAKFGLDADVDYTENAKCLVCHTTGYGKAGGYRTPDPEDKRAVRKAKDFHGVGCESCHGPGSEYVKVFEEIDESQRSYSVQELYAVGMRKVDKAGCLECHNDKGPTFNADDPFDYDKIMEEEKAKTKGVALHVHKPLKLRQD
jgi:hypothetical protein